MNLVTALQFPSVPDEKSSEKITGGPLATVIGSDGGLAGPSFVAASTAVTV